MNTIINSQLCPDYYLICYNLKKFHVVAAVNSHLDDTLQKKYADLQIYNNILPSDIYEMETTVQRSQLYEVSHSRLIYKWTVMIVGCLLLWFLILHLFRDLVGIQDARHIHLHTALLLLCLP